MATARIGESGPIMGTTDRGYGFIESVEATKEVDEAEIRDGDGDIVGVDQYGPRTGVSFEYTSRGTGGPDMDDVGSGAAVSIPEGGVYGIPATAYLRSSTTSRSKAPGYQTQRCEGTSWPSLGS